MAAYLPNLMQNMFNTPLALSSRKAEMICAALSGRFNIQSLETETMKLDARAMRDLAEMGRKDASVFRNDKIAAKAPTTASPSQDAEDGWYGDRPYELTASGIAVVKIKGTLTRTWGVGPFSGATGYDGIWTQLLFAQDDPQCRAIWLDINSGGGAVDGLFDLVDGIRAMSARNGGKPIWAMAADYAFSAAYALACACDKVFVPPLGGVGSIGCITIYVDQSEALKADGLNAMIFRSGARKAIGIGGIETLDQKEQDHIQEQIDEAGLYFVEKVAELRGIAKSKVSETEGWDYTGAKARAIGLVNDVLSEPEAWAKLERIIAR